MIVAGFTAKGVANAASPVVRETVVVEFKGPIVTRHDIIMVGTFTKENAIYHVSDLHNVQDVAMLLKLSRPMIQESVMLTSNVANGVSVSFASAVVALYPPFADTPPWTETPFLGDHEVEH